MQITMAIPVKRVYTYDQADEELKTIVRAIGKDLDIASYKTVGQMLDQFTPEVMDKLIQCGDQTLDGGLTSGYEWAAMIQSMKNNPNLCSLKIDRESTAMHGGDAGKTKARPFGKETRRFESRGIKTPFAREI